MSALTQDWLGAWVAICTLDAMSIQMKVIIFLQNCFDNVRFLLYSMYLIRQSIQLENDSAKTR